MKKIICLFIAFFTLLSTYLFAQNANDTTLAIAIKSSIPQFSSVNWYTFNAKTFELNQDSAKLYELTQTGPSIAALKKSSLSWRPDIDYNPKYGDNQGWHKGYLVRASGQDLYAHGYECGVGNYTEALTGKSPYGEYVIKRISPTIITVTDIVEKGKISYLVLHKKIIPSEILLTAISSDCWAVAVYTRYKKPAVNMVLIPDSLKPTDDPALLKRLESLINDSTLGNPPKVAESSPVAPVKTLPTNFDVTVSTKDTISFQDFEREDGDKVSIFFDGNIIQELVGIEHKPYKIPLGSNVSVIEILAEDEGTEHPCTIEVVINGKTKQFYKKKGERVTILRK